MEGQAILALIAVFALGAMVGAVITSAAVKAFSNTTSSGTTVSAIPHLPALDVTTIERVTKQIGDLAIALKTMKG